MEHHKIEYEKVTVLIPTYNRKDYLIQSLNSILAQTYPNIQIMIYDDGSTDRTVEYIQSLKDTNKAIYYTQSEKNRGVSYARNKLLDMCDTEIACWQDSDDISNIHRISLQMERLSECSMVLTSFERLLENKTKNKKLPQIIPYQFAHASCLFRVDTNVRFDENLIIGEDNDWRGRMELKYESVYMPQALYYIRFHKNRLSAENRYRKNK